MEERLGEETEVSTRGLSWFYLANTPRPAHSPGCLLRPLPPAMKRQNVPCFEFHLAQQCLRATALDRAGVDWRLASSADTTIRRHVPGAFHIKIA